LGYFVPLKKKLKVRPKITGYIRPTGKAKKVSKTCVFYTFLEFEKAKLFIVLLDYAKYPDL